MHNFFFDYIYYRITRTYFKWDGRTGGTAIVAISLMESLVILDIMILITQFFFDRLFFAPYAKVITPIAFALLFGFGFFNYRKYNGTYNKFRSYWKNESESAQTLKGFLVVASIFLPFVPLILISILN
jgi:hypothetical protein